MTKNTPKNKSRIFSSILEHSLSSRFRLLSQYLATFFHLGRLWVKIYHFQKSFQELKGMDVCYKMHRSNMTNCIALKRKKLQTAKTMQITQFSLKTRTLFPSPLLPFPFFFFCGSVRLFSCHFHVQSLFLHEVMIDQRSCSAGFYIR